MNNTKASTLLFFLVIYLFFSSSLAFNITRLLGQKPEFSSLNDYLTQTKLSDEINRRRTITFLAIDNSAISSLSGKPLEVIKKILSVHVILDYYDVEKITKLGISNKTSVLTTLFQASGVAVDQQGFLDVSLVNEGEIAFGSAVKGAALNAKLVKSVAAQPYNISVLQITAPIQVPGIESSTPPPPQSTRPSTSPVPVPKKSPVNAPSPSKKPVAPTPSKSSEAPAPVEDDAAVPAAEPAADAPESDDAPAAEPVADGPDSDVPTSSPPKPDVAADNADAPAPKASAASRSQMAVGAGVVVALVSCLLA